MLMIRFQRIGRKNDPAFRIVVLEKSSGPKAGKYVDLVGTYNPKTKAFTADGARIKEWMDKGAQLSPSLKNLLISKTMVEGKKVAVISKTNLEKNKAKQEEEAAAAAAAAPVAAAAPEEEAVPAEKAPVGEPADAAPEEVVVEEAKEEAPVAA